MNNRLFIWLSALFLAWIPINFAVNNFISGVESRNIQKAYTMQDVETGTVRSGGMTEGTRAEGPTRNDGRRINRSRDSVRPDENSFKAKHLLPANVAALHGGSL